MERYLIKDSDYFNSVRTDVIQMIPQNSNNKILEIGAGAGDTLVFLKKNSIASYIVGVELVEIQNSNQKSPLIDKFIIGNIEELDLELEKNFFDVIICADVLEHTVDPWKIIKHLTPLLKKGGHIIVSLPNIRDFVTMFKIFILKDFKYDPKSGVLDITHLRFFCKKNILNLVSTDELKPISCKSSFKLKRYSLFENRRRLLNIITLGLFSDLLTTQYIVTAKK